MTTDPFPIHYFRSWPLAYGIWKKLRLHDAHTGWVICSQTQENGTKKWCLRAQNATGGTVYLRENGRVE